MPKLSGNKGEWSEIYAFLRLLEIKKLYAADSQLNKKDEILYEHPHHTWRVNPEGLGTAR